MAAPTGRIWLTQSTSPRGPDSTTSAQSQAGPLQRLAGEVTSDGQPLLVEDVGPINVPFPKYPVCCVPLAGSILTLDGRSCKQKKPHVTSPNHLFLSLYIPLPTSLIHSSFLFRPHPQTPLVSLFIPLTSTTFCFSFPQGFF